MSETTWAEPRANADFFGHDEPLHILVAAMASGRLHHGWLLHGRQGIGKATLAYRFARALLKGSDRPDPRLAMAPDQPVFRQVMGGAHPDLFVIEPERDPKTGKIKAEIPVDAVRTATTALHSTPAIADRRVLLVDGAERLNRNAANALLKPLEEPPSAGVIILVSHRLSQVTPTLRSRCAKLPMAGLSNDLLGDLLQKFAPDLGSDRRAAVIELAKGSLGQAIDMASDDWLASFETLARTLGASRPSADRLDALATSLAKQSAKHGFVTITGLIQKLLGRLIAHATGRLDAPLFEGERSALDQLLMRRPLDHWPGLWEKIARLSAAVDGLNLDHPTALAQILASLASPPANTLPFAGHAASPRALLSGGQHVLG